MPTPHRFARRRLANAVAAALISLPALALAEADNDAGADAGEGPPLELEFVTVEAVKIPTTLDNIPASVTVIDADRMERELVESIDDLVRYEPGIDVVDQGSRFGRAGFSIRGLGGNRVLVEVDGVPVSDAFAIGDFSNASRDFVDVDSLKQVEIIRGPSSALFGSEALGGVVSFVTRDPTDYLDENDSNLRATAAWYGLDDSFAGTATAAGAGGDLSALLTATYREGHERNDTGADPMDYDSINLLGKLVWGTVGQGGLKFTVDHFEGDSRTEVDSLENVQDFSASFGFPYIISTTEVSADDSRERTRFGFEQSWNEGLGFTDFLRWRAYTMDSETRQDTFQARETLIVTDLTQVTRQRLFIYEQELLGAEVTAASRFELGATAHELTYGIEVEQTDTSQLRDGLETNLVTGETSNVVGPDDYPVRDFPNSETTSIGVYLQDSIRIGAVTLVPALRWDEYDLDPKPDAIFIEDNPTTETASLSESELSPKLGVLWDLDESWQIYGQYSEGFRAPPVNDVNVGFTNFQFGYTAIANPDLESETSQGVELGLRYAGETAQWELSGYRSEYENFIESFQSVGFDPVNNLVIFQSVNLTDVEIEGIEFRGQWAPSVFPDGLYVRFAASWAEGDNRENGQPLNSVAPPSGVLGLEYDAPSRRWGGSFVGRAAEQQDRVDETAGPVYRPDGYVVFDATAWWKPTANTRLRAGLFNLFDEEYTAWLDVAGLSADTPDLERFQRPGRNVTVAFDWNFR